MSNKGVLSDGRTYPFKYWEAPGKVLVQFDGEEYPNQFRPGKEGFDEIAAAFPYHPITPEQQAEIDAAIRKETQERNKQHLFQSLRNVSQSVDNPTHWNRLSPEIKSAMQTYYRELLKIREHKDFSGAAHIHSDYGGTGFPAMPIHDTLEDMDGTPHSEVHLLLEENTPLKCCLLYTSPSPRDRQKSRMPSSA